MKSMLFVIALGSLSIRVTSSFPCRAATSAMPNPYHQPFKLWKDEPFVQHLIRQPMGFLAGGVTDDTEFAQFCTSGHARCKGPFDHEGPRERESQRERSIQHSKKVLVQLTGVGRRGRGRVSSRRLCRSSGEPGPADFFPSEKFRSRCKGGDLSAAGHLTTEKFRTCLLRLH